MQASEAEGKPRVVIVYHSQTGHTAAQARAVLEGARSVADAALISVGEVEERWNELDAADALIFGCPTYIGDVSAGFKSFIEGTTERYLQQRWDGKLAAAFTNSSCLNGDKLHTLTSLALFAAQHGMTWINLGLLGGHERHHLEPTQTNRLGSWLGAMAQSNFGEDPGQAPPAGDLETARLASAALASR